MKKTLLGLLLILSIVFVGCSKTGTSEEENTKVDPQVEQPSRADQDEETNTTEDISSPDSQEKETIYAPDFELTDLEGNTVKLSDYKGKVVFLNFWAEWCGYCKKEMPDMQKMYKDYEVDKDDFVILAVNVQDTRETIDTYLSDKDFEFTILMDTDGSVASKYYIQSFPTTFMIDKEGAVIGYQPGMLTEEMMRQVIEQSLQL